MGSKTLKRLISSVLSLSILCTQFVTMPVLAETNDTSLTESQIVMNHYAGELSEQETAIMDKWLNSETHSFIPVADEDGLITLTGDIVVTVEAAPYTKDSYEWVPVKAYLVEGGNRTEIANFENGQGTVTPATGTYSVEVEYKSYLTVSTETQEMLLNATYWGDQVIKGLDALADGGVDSVNYLSSDISFDGTTYSIIEMMYVYFVEGQEINLPSYDGFNMKLNEASSVSTVTAITELYNDWVDGGFDFVNLSNDYENNYRNSNELAFVNEGKAGQLKVLAEDLIANANTIYSCEQFTKIFNVLSWFGGNDPVAQAAESALRGIINQIGSPNLETSIAAALTGALNYDWTLLSNTQLFNATKEASAAVRTAECSKHTATTEQLLLATATVGAGVNSADVTYTINVTVVENNTLVEKSFTSDKIRLAKGLTMAEVDAVIETEVENYITANWGAYNLNDTYYGVTWSYADYGTLEDNQHYEITYVPNYYDVTGVMSGSYPYGWKLTLPSGASEGLLYSYTVNGATKNEGEVLFVDRDFQIVRNQQDLFRVLEIVAKYYGYTSEDKEYQVFMNGALKSDKVSYNTPENAEELLTLVFDGEGYKLTAKEYLSGAANMTWVPEGYYLDGVLKPFDSIEGDMHVAQIDSTTLMSVNVKYRLDIKSTLDGKTVDSDYIEEAVNLPYELKEVSSKQVRIMDTLYSYLNSNELKDKLGAIPTGLTTFRNNIWLDYDTNGDGIPDPSISEANYTTEDKLALDSISTILSECFSGSELIVKQSVDAYHTIGLKAYYEETGYNTYLDQMDTLILNLDNIVTHAKFKPMLESLGFGDLYEDVLGIVGTLSGYKADLSEIPPSDKIDITHPNVSDLFAVLSDSNVTFTTVAANGLADTTVLTINANGVVGVNVVVTVNNVIGEDPKVLKSEGDVVNLAVTETFTDAHVQALNDEIARLVATLPEKDFVSVTIDNMPEAGQGAEKLTVNVTCDPIEIPVKVNGVATGETVAYGSTVVNLPSHTTIGYVYEYHVMGVEIASGLTSYTLNSAELKAAFALGYVDIERTEVNVGESNLVSYVDTLNSGLGAGETKFVLVENNGEYSIVLRVATSEVNTIQAKLMGMAQALAMGSYSYLAMGDDIPSHVIWNGEQISVQAIINALLSSGLSFDTIIGMMDEDGNLKNMDSAALGNNVLVGNASDLDNLGAALMVSDLYLGTSNSSTYSLRRSGHQQIDLYVTLSDGNMKDVKDALVALKPYLDVNTDNSKLNMTINVPDRAYQAILAGMLMTGYADLDDVSDVKFEAFVKYLEAQFDEAVLNPNVSADTYQNTMDELNVGYSLAAYKDTINTILKAVRKVNGALSNKTITSNSYSFTMNAHSDDLVSALGLNDTYALLLKKEPLTADAIIKVENFGVAYEAVYFDNSKSGLDKVHFTKDFAAVAPTLGNNAIVILLGDVAGDVVLNDGIILDLNGKTMPSLKANAGTTKIFNSAFEADGGVTGTISGNFTIAGGKYGSDVSSMVVEGYTQTNGVVESDLYRAYMDGNKLVVELEVDFIDPARETDLTYFAIDLALQMGLEFYTASKLNVEGSDIYAFESADLIADFFGDTNIVNTALHILNYPGLTTFTNTVIDDLTNWGALAAAVESGNPLVSYDLTTTPWGVSLTHIAADDYMSVAVAGDSSVAKDYTLEIRVRGNASDDDNVYLAKLLREFEKVLTVDADVALNDVSYSNEHGLTADYFGDGEIVIDFTQADNGTDYTTLMGLILAYANPSMKTPLQNYIDKGDVSGLIDAFDELTVANVISAIKSIRGVSFAKLSAGYDAADVAYLESIYHVFLQGTAGVLNKLEVTGRSTKLGALAVADGVYEIEKSLGNISGKITLKLFAEKDPELVAYVNPNNDLIKGYEIDYVTKEIRLDLAVTETFNGLSLSKFYDVFHLGFTVNSGEIINTVFDDDTVAAGVLRNGTVIRVEFAKAAGATSTYEDWTILILGDVNGNGKIDSNDANLMMKSYFGTVTLNDYQLWAADVDGTGAVVAHDALQNAMKWTLKDGYSSKLLGVAKEVR